MKLDMCLHLHLLESSSTHVGRRRPSFSLRRYQNACLCSTCRWFLRWNPVAEAGLYIKSVTIWGEGATECRNQGRTDLREFGGKSINTDFACSCISCRLFQICTGHTDTLRYRCSIAFPTNLQRVQCCRRGPAFLRCQVFIRPVCLWLCIERSRSSKLVVSSGQAVKTLTLRRWRWRIVGI